VNWLDHVFDARHGYHVGSHPAGHFDKPGEDHTKGEGDENVFLILRMPEGSLEDQYEEVEVERDEQMCLPEHYLPAALMRHLKEDMHLRRYKMAWGFERERGKAEQHPRDQKHLETTGIGEIGACVIDGDSARIPVRIELVPKHQVCSPARENLQKALDFVNRMHAEDLVESVEASTEEVGQENGRHVVTGELNIRLKRQSDGTYAPAWRGKRKDTEKRRCRRLDPDFLWNLPGLRKAKDTGLSNLYVPDAGYPKFVTGSDDHFRAEVELRDTRQNTVRQVGSAYAFATIQGAINASASGDVVEVYGNGATPLVSGDYNENLVDNALNGIQVTGMLASQGVRVHSNAGTLLSIALNYAWLVENIEFDGEGTAAGGIALAGSHNTLSHLVIHDINGRGVTMSAYSLAVNCAAYDCVVGFEGTAANVPTYTACTAVDCSTAGFSGNGPGRIICIACLGSTNTADFVNAVALFSTWNASSDLTAPGSSPQTGFLNTDFVNYAGDDFRLLAAVKATTQARFDGNPPVKDDAFYARRSKTLTGAAVFYAGFHHPITVPTGLAATNPNTNGDLDVTWTNAADYTDGELMFILDDNSSAVLGVFEADAGTGRITGLTNGVAVVIRAEATAEGNIFCLGGPVFPAPPPGGACTKHIRVFDRTFVDMQG